MKILKENTMALLLASSMIFLCFMTLGDVADIQQSDAADYDIRLDAYQINTTLWSLIGIAALAVGCICLLEAVRYIEDIKNAARKGRCPGLENCEEWKEHRQYSEFKPNEPDMVIEVNEKGGK